VGLATTTKETLRIYILEILSRLTNHSRNEKLKPVPTNPVSKLFEY